MYHPAKSHTLVYSPQCPNCTRFLDALRRTHAAQDVDLVDVHTLGPEQQARLAAVPALLTGDGTTLYGTKAFEWLKQFEGDLELESFTTGKGLLGFSDVSSLGYVSYAENYSAFEPVQDI